MTVQIAGDFDDAMIRVRQVSQEMGIYLVNSVNPFRLEGQKTIMFRVLEALRWEPPDWIVVPGGNLGNSSAFGKAFAELYELGLIPRIPRLAVINADAGGVPTEQAIGRIRAANTAASILLISAKPKQHRQLAIELGLQDLIDIEDAEHLALALRREHRTQLLRSETRRLRRQLEEAEERSNLLVQSSRDAIAYIHEGMYLNTNQAYLDLFGYQSPDELDGLPIMDMIDAESRVSFKAALRKISENSKYAEEFRCVASDDQRFNARMEFSPASIDGERCTQVMIRDQSQNLALQERIEELTSKDTQTGFFNRQSFMERLEALVGSAASAEKGYALVQISIANFSDMREACGFGYRRSVFRRRCGVVLGVGLWMTVGKELLWVAGLGAFGPGLLRELGWQNDQDEFQRETVDLLQRVIVEETDADHAHDAQHPGHHLAGQVAAEGGYRGPPARQHHAPQQQGALVCAPHG